MEYGKLFVQLGDFLRAPALPLLEGLFGLEMSTGFSRELLPDLIQLWIYSMLEKWHLISFLKTPRTLKVIKDVRVSAAEPEKLDAPYHLIQEDLGYDLFRAV